MNEFLETLPLWLVYSIALFILSYPVYMSWVCAKGSISRFISNNIAFTGYVALATFAWTVYLMIVNDIKGMTEMVELCWWLWGIALIAKFLYLHKDNVQLEKEIVSKSENQYLFHK